MVFFTGDDVVGDLDVIEPDIGADHTLVRWDEPLGSYLSPVESPAGRTRVATGFWMERRPPHQAASRGNGP